MAMSAFLPFRQAIAIRFAATSYSVCCGNWLAACRVSSHEDSQASLAYRLHAGAHSLEQSSSFSAACTLLQCRDAQSGAMSAATSLLRAAQLEARGSNQPRWVLTARRSASTSMQSRKESLDPPANPSRSQPPQLEPNNAKTLPDNFSVSGSPIGESQEDHRTVKRHQIPGFAVDWSMMTSAGVGEAFREMLMELAHVGIQNYKTVKAKRARKQSMLQALRNQWRRATWQVHDVYGGSSDVSDFADVPGVGVVGGGSVRVTANPNRFLIRGIIYEMSSLVYNEGTGEGKKMSGGKGQASGEGARPAMSGVTVAESTTTFDPNSPPSQAGQGSQASGVRGGQMVKASQTPRELVAEEEVEQARERRRQLALEAAELAASDWETYLLGTTRQKRGEEEGGGGNGSESTGEERASRVTRGASLSEVDEAVFLGDAEDVKRTVTISLKKGRDASSSFRASPSPSLPSSPPSSFPSSLPSSPPPSPPSSPPSSPPPSPPPFAPHSSSVPLSPPRAGGGSLRPPGPSSAQSSGGGRERLEALLSGARSDSVRAKYQERLREKKLLAEARSEQGRAGEGILDQPWMKGGGAARRRAIKRRGGGEGGGVLAVPGSGGLLRHFKERTIKQALLVCEQAAHSSDGSRSISAGCSSSQQQNRARESEAASDEQPASAGERLGDKDPAGAGAGDLRAGDVKQLQLRVRDLVDQIGAVCFDTQITSFGDSTGSRESTRDDNRHAATSADSLPGQRSSLAPASSSSHSGTPLTSPTAPSSPSPSLMSPEAAALGSDKEGSPEALVTRMEQTCQQWGLHPRNVLVVLGASDASKPLLQALEATGFFICTLGWSEGEEESKKRERDGGAQSDMIEEGFNMPLLPSWSLLTGVEDEDKKEIVKSKRAQFSAYSLLEVKAIVEGMNGVSYRSSTFARTKGY